MTIVTDSNSCNQTFVDGVLTLFVHRRRKRRLIYDQSPQKVPGAVRALLGRMRTAVLPERKEARHVVHGPDISLS
jgi:hypothetical protein